MKEKIMKKLVLLAAFLVTPLMAQPRATLGAAQSQGTVGTTLTWTASITGGVTYNPFRTTVASGSACPTAISSYTQIATGITGTTFSDTTATNVGVYCYVVTASGGGLTSGPSNVATVTVSPQPPTGLTASAN
jgi:hypothetical protein